MNMCGNGQLMKCGKIFLQSGGSVCLQLVVYRRSWKRAMKVGRSSGTGSVALGCRLMLNAGHTKMRRGRIVMIKYRLLLPTPEVWNGSCDVAGEQEACDGISTDESICSVALILTLRAISLTFLSGPFPPHHYGFSDKQPLMDMRTSLRHLLARGDEASDSTLPRLTSPWTLRTLCTSNQAPSFPSTSSLSVSSSSSSSSSNSSPPSDAPSKP